MSTEFEEGVLVGLLIGEGHFGGDGRQPHITLRMHVRHESLFRWLERTFPGGRLYGPYDHNGRHYYQWMVRGAYLRDHLLPLIERRLGPDLDAHAHVRIREMRARYAGRLGRPATDPPAEDPASTSRSGPGARSVGIPPGPPSRSRSPGSGSRPTPRRGLAPAPGSAARHSHLEGPTAALGQLAEQIFRTLRRGTDSGHDLDEAPGPTPDDLLQPTPAHGVRSNEPSLDRATIRTTGASPAHRRAGDIDPGTGKPAG